MGAQSTYNEETAAKICERIAEGEFLRVICREEGMPSFGTVYRWRQEFPHFAERLARARESGCEAIFEDTLAIADEQQAGEITTVEPDAEGKEVVTKRVTKDMLDHRKLRIDARHKALRIFDPSRYGEKITQEITGPGGAPMFEERGGDRAARILGILAVARARASQGQELKESDITDLL